MSLKRQHIGYNLKYITIALFIALVVTSFTGCSNSDEPTIDLPNESAAVMFNTSIESETQTRATTLDDATLKSEGFGVLAYYTNNNNWVASATTATPDFMYNQKVTYGSAWSYSPVKYWPNNTNDKVSFFGYAPYESSPDDGANKGIKLSANTETGTPTIDFTVNTNSIANQVDLVYASALDKNREVVNLQFKHALSRIAFSAKAAEDYGETVINVKSISIGGKFYSSGKLNLLDGTWSDTTATDVTTYKKEGLNIALNNTTEQPLLGEGQYLMIIPKNFTGANDKIKVTVTYTSTAYDGVESDIISKDVYIEDKNFKQSEAYNIVLNISLEGITSEVTYIPYGQKNPVKLKNTTIKVTKTDGTEVGNISINTDGKYTYIPTVTVANGTPVTMNYSYLVPENTDGTFEDVYSTNTTVGDLKSGVSIDFGNVKKYRVTGNIKYNHIGWFGITELRDVPANASLSVLSNNATAKMLPTAGRYELITTNIPGDSESITINYYGSYLGLFQGNYNGSKSVSTLRENQYFELKR